MTLLAITCNVGLQQLIGPMWQVIAELDEKKREALHKTWLKVNQDFGSIFSTLLPGTSAKLEPPEGQDYLAGEAGLALTSTWWWCTEALGSWVIGPLASQEPYTGSVKCQRGDWIADCLRAELLTCSLSGM